MKSIYNKLLILLLIPALTGCRYSFEIPDNGLEPCICLMSYICADSLSNVNVYKAVPVQMSGRADMTIESASYSLKRNGKETEVTSRDIENYGISLSGERFKEGDRLELTFSADGMDMATASTTVPGKFPDYTAERYVDENGTDCLRFTYDDNKETDDYYAVSIETRNKIITGVDEFFYFNGSVSPPADHNELSINQFAYAPVVTNFNGKTLYIWADSDEEDDAYDLKYIFNSNFSSSDEVAIRFVLYKLSKEMYHHLYADYDASYNPFAYIGFSSPSFAYTNVMKGCGYFCAYSVRQSDWTIISTEENEWKEDYIY